MLKNVLLSAALLVAIACHSDEQPLIQNAAQPSLGVRPVIKLPANEILPPMDSFTVDKMSIEGNTLTMFVTYPKGCMHDFFLFWDGTVRESPVPQIEFPAVHESHAEFCETPFTDMLLYDLNPFARLGHNKLVINITGGDVAKSIEFTPANPQPVEPTKPSPLTFGGTIKIAVDEPVEFVEIEIPRQGLHKLPLARITNETADFHCEILELTKAPTPEGALPALDTYRIGIGSSGNPGLGLCEVEIENPYNGQVATVELFLGL